jgi:hypothetical protein
MRLPLILLTAALLSATPAAGQTTFKLGVRGGLNRSTTTLAGTSTGTYFYYNIYASYSGDKSAIFSWQAGTVAEIAFGKFALQPGLLFSQKGEQFHTSAYLSGVAGMSGAETSSINRYNWLELPLNVVYTVHGVQVFGGPYVAMAVGGRQKGTTLQTSPFARYAPLHFEENIEYGTATSNRRFDAGVNFGLGYRKGPIQVQLGYGLGFVNLHQIDSDNPEDVIHNFQEDAAYNRVVQLTGTYFYDL